MLSVSTLATQVRGVVNDSAASPESSGGSPYSSIWLRNVFDLKPVPPPAAEAVKPAEPPPNVHLTGITTLLGKKKALFMVQKKSSPGKTGSPDESYILSEGQREGSLEVLAIDTDSHTVKIKLEDVISTITFETNKMTGGSGAPAADNPAFHRFNPTFAPGYGGNPYPNRSAMPNPSAYAPGNQQPAPQGYNQNYNQGGYSGGGYASPGYSQPNVTPSPVANTSTPVPANIPTQTEIPPPNISDQERVLIAAAESAIRSGTISTGQNSSTGTTTTSTGAPSLGNINSITIPPIPSTPPPPLNSR